MKFILNLFLFSVLLFATALPPEKTFLFSTEKNSQASDIILNLDKKVYLYKDKLKIFQNDVDITKSYEFKSVLKDQDEVIFDKLIFDFPNFRLNENDKIDIFYQGCSLEGLCYQPLAAEFVYKNNNLTLNFSNKEARKIKEKTQENKDEINISKSSFLLNLATFFVYGLLLSLTPCTLPMVPILSSILAKSSGKNPIISSVIYVLGMSISYTIAGVIAALLGSGVQEFFQNPITISVFALIFVILSLSMFGLFEIKLPSFFVNKINTKSAKLSGILGIFIMGILSALIVGPCVAAPLAAILIYIANTNDIILGASALFVMSIGMGIPLIAIGFGFKFITGAWMQLINKFFGFVLLGLAIFFLERLLDEKIIYILYALLGFSFCVFFKLFESAKNNFYLFLKLPLIIILAFSFLYFNKAFLQENSINNQVEFKLAKDRLVLKDKNLLYFTADWCENCKVMHNTTFKNKDVINALNSLNLIKIDLTKPNEFEKNLAKKYQVFGPPVLVLVDKDGKVLKQIVGLVDAKTLLKELDF